MSSSTSSQDYLASQASILNNTQPTTPSEALAAQIPLQSFSLPEFPPEASKLQSLTLTSDIKLDEYTSLLTSPPASMPLLPASITSLTLELFSLGYPAGFLTALSHILPNLRGLTIYSQLFAGTTPASRADALQFLRNEKDITALHLLDVFAPVGFLAEAGEIIRSNGHLRFLEINYTFRHSDKEFLKTVNGRDLTALMGRELVTCALSIGRPDVGDDEDDKEGDEQGILAVEGDGAKALVERLSGEERPRALMALDVTMFQLSVEGLGKVLEAHRDLRVLAVTVELGFDREERKDIENIANALGICKQLEQVEMVGVPSEEWVKRATEGQEILPTEEELADLGKKCRELKKVKMSILRTREVEWVRGNEKWTRS